MLPATQADNSVLKVLFAHNTWANLKLLDFCETLSEEQLDATVPGTYGAIADNFPLLFERGHEHFMTKVAAVLNPPPPKPPRAEDTGKS